MTGRHHPAARFVMNAERTHYERRQRQIDRRRDERCGICQQEILPGQRTDVVDDERCHHRCTTEEPE